MNSSIKEGRLNDLLPQFQRIDNAYEIMVAGINDPELRKKAFWTGDFVGGINYDGRHVLYCFGDFKYNPLLGQYENAIWQFKHDERRGVFTCTPEETEMVVSRGLVMSTSDLGLRITGGLAVIEIDPQKPYDMSYAHLRIAKRIFGREKYDEVMHALSQDRQQNTYGIRVRLLSPEIMLRNAKPGEMIARVSIFRGLGEFDAFNRYDDGYPGRVRGELLDNI